MAKSVAPSMRAAAMIIEVRMSPVAVGWRADALHGGGGELADAEADADDGEAGAEAGGEVTESENWFMVVPFRSASGRGVWTGRPWSRGACRARLPMARGPSRPTCEAWRPRRAPAWPCSSWSCSSWWPRCASPAPMKSAESMVKM